MKYTRKDAEISPCGRFRYFLSREWNEPGTRTRFVTFIGINPSTADADLDDPTIRRCVGFARDWGFTGLIMVNLWPYRATNIEDMKKFVHDTLPGMVPTRGPKAADVMALTQTNYQWVDHARKKSELYIAAWGSEGGFYDMGTRFKTLLFAREPLLCLGLSKMGNPFHPLYQPANASPVPWPANPDYDCFSSPGRCRCRGGVSRTLRECNGCDRWRAYFPRAGEQSSKAAD